jgi:hypothetical protein
MADMTVRVPQGYPVGTTLSVYVDRVGDIQPQGTPVSTSVIAADSTATLTGLTPQIPYQVGAVISGKWRSFLVEMALPVATDVNAVATELAAHEADATTCTASPEPSPATLRCRRLDGDSRTAAGASGRAGRRIAARSARRAERDRAAAGVR